jgi:hypothetical protein
LLQPVGASGWVTDTEYVGMTIYMYSATDGRIYQVTNAKPTRFFGSDPRTLMRNQISDYVTFTIYDLAHGAFAFRHAKEADSRLSLHKDLVLEKAPWFGADAYAALAARDWVELVDRIRTGELHPVRGAESFLAYIEPTSYGGLVIDQKSQTARLELGDEHGASMWLEVKLRPENNFLIDNLEFLQPKPDDSKKLERMREDLIPNGLFGRAWISGGALKFFPLTAIYHNPVTLKMRQTRQVHEIHLSLEELAKVEAVG